MIREKLTQEQILNLVNDWERTKALLDEVSDAEKNMRLRLFNALVEAPKKGANKAVVNDKLTLTFTQGETSKVDTEAFKACIAKLREIGVDPNDIVKWDPSLIADGYKNLNKEQKLFADTNFLTFKPSALPSLKLIRK